jgi:hypothetical protein
LCMARLSWMMRNALFVCVLVAEAVHMGVLYSIGGDTLFRQDSLQPLVLVLSLFFQCAAIAITLLGAYWTAQAMGQDAKRSLSIVHRIHMLSSSAGRRRDAAWGRLFQLLQGYLSMIVLFSGIYVTVYLSSPGSQPFSLRCGRVCQGLPDASGRGPSLATVSFWEVVTELLYLSSASLTGNGDGSVYPTQWWSRLVVGISMLCGVLFNVVILAMGSSAMQDMVVIDDALHSAASRQRRRRRKLPRHG